MSWTSCWDVDLLLPNQTFGPSQCQLLNLLAELMVTNFERINYGLTGGFRLLKLRKVLGLPQKTFSDHFFSWFFLVLGSIDG